MRGIFIAALCLFLMVGAHAHAQTNGRSKTTALDTPPDPPDANPQYFPKRLFNDPSESGSFNDFVARWYSKQLRAMAEPSLFNASDDKRVVAYRFLWLRTFHQPVAVRLTIRPDGTGLIIGKVMSGRGGYEPGKLSWKNAGEVSFFQVQQFLGLLQTASFWTLETEVMKGANDGAQWILEGVRHGTYHVVDRWTPGMDDYSRACFYLLELSKITVPAKDIY